MNLNVADMPWEQCMSDLPLDSNNPLPPLNSFSSSSSDDLPQLDLLDLFPFEDPNESDNATPNISLNQDMPLTPTSNKFKDLTTTIQLSPIHDIDTDDDTTHTNPTCSTSSDTQSDASSPNISITSNHIKSTNSIKLDLNNNNNNNNTTSSQNEVVLELSTRLAAAGAEANALRKRVAQLTGENRNLRSALDHANARLIAVAQAATINPSTTTTTTTTQPMMLGLAQVSSDMANKFTGAITVSDNQLDDSPRERKKRKRVTGTAGAAATTMACVMFMWGAFIGTPGLFKGTSSSFRSDANLPAIWNGNENNPHGVVPVRTGRKDNMQIDHQRWLPNCKRVLEVLPTGKEIPQVINKDQRKTSNTLNTKTEARIRNGDNQQEKDETNNKKLFVDVDQDNYAANTVTKADLVDRRHPEYSYVLCRDADKAVNSIKACAENLGKGETCGPPQTISLILPASAAGMTDENDTNNIQPGLAEVQCSIMSVARIPVEGINDQNDESSGRIIATIPETATVIHE